MSISNNNIIIYCHGKYKKEKQSENNLIAKSNALKLDNIT